MLRVCVFILLLNSFISYAENIDDQLKKVKEKYNLPALAAAVTKDGKIVASGVVGFRNSAARDKVTLQDKFHIGSCTKSMTATLAAMFVEEGKIKWTSTIAEIFPEMKDDFLQDYHNVTLEQLLSHTGGINSIPNSHRDIWMKIYNKKNELSPLEQRKFLLSEALKLPPAYEPGKGFTYSNSGTTIAGMMLEKVAGRAWEDLLIDKLAKPLGITSIGFGLAAKDANKIDQPYGHVQQGKVNIPVPPGKFVGNPSAIAPAGLVYLTVEDFARYTAFYAAKCRKLLKEESFKKLTQPVKNNFALGWVAVKRPWGGNVITHDGSNTINYAVMWIAPEKNFSVVVMTNTYGDEVMKGVDEMAGQLIVKFLK